MEDEKEDMTSMVSIVNKLAKEGYTTQFKAHQGGLTSLASEKEFSSGDVIINHFYRFEGDSSPDDNAIVYAIETKTGERGTLIDAYGANNDPFIQKFIKEVEDIHK